MQDICCSQRRPLNHTENIWQAEVKSTGKLHLQIIANRLQVFHGVRPKSTEDFSTGKLYLQYTANKLQNSYRSSAPNTNLSLPLHLFVLVHGIVGSKHDFDFWEELMNRRGHQNWRLHKVGSITDHLSFSRQISCGRGAMRLQELATELVLEVTGWVQSCVYKGARVILHFVCHSLGGLLARTAMPELCRKLDVAATSRECSITYGHFLTLCTPHIGIQAATWRVAHSWKNLVQFKDLHKQVAARDEELFLEQLADPAGEYLPHLAKFQHRTAVGATHWDALVPFCTAAICSRNPFPRYRLPTWFGLTSFWRIHAVVGFLLDGHRPLHERLERDAEVAADSPRYGAEGHPASLLQAHICELEGNAETLRPRRENMEQSHPSWETADDGNVVFTETMLLGLVSIKWRRIAFTLHKTGDIPHTFPIGKSIRSDWSAQFIDLLIDMIEEAS